ncbi:hypothetical protein AZOA_26770 [Azoarcus sp. Aa7]|nr:hypothetical protein [Azoarcus sp. Aa7]
MAEFESFGNQLPAVCRKASTLGGKGLDATSLIKFVAGGIEFCAEAFALERECRLRVDEFRIRSADLRAIACIGAKGHTDADRGCVRIALTELPAFAGHSEDELRCVASCRAGLVEVSARQFCSTASGDQGRMTVEFGCHRIRFAIHGGLGKARQCRIEPLLAQQAGPCFGHCRTGLLHCSLRTVGIDAGEVAGHDPTLHIGGEYFGLGDAALVRVQIVLRKPQ